MEAVCITHQLLHPRGERARGAKRTGDWVGSRVGLGVCRYRENENKIPRLLSNL